MTRKELNIWYRYTKALERVKKNGSNCIDPMNGVYMEREDYQELYRLNHLVMEQANKIHNDNMLNKCNHKMFTDIGIKIICPKCSDIPTI